MEAVDKYTLRFRLKETDYIFLYIAAHAHSAPWRAKWWRLTATTCRRIRSDRAPTC